MRHILGMTVIDRLEKGTHVRGSLLLGKCLVLLLAYLFEQRLPWNVFHYQVNEFCIIVGLVIFYDVRVIQCIQGHDLIHDDIKG